MGCCKRIPRQPSGNLLEDNKRWRSEWGGMQVMQEKAPKGEKKLQWEEGGTTFIKSPSWNNCHISNKDNVDDADVRCPGIVFFLHLANRWQKCGSNESQSSRRSMTVGYLQLLLNDIHHHSFSSTPISTVIKSRFNFPHKSIEPIYGKCGMCQISFIILLCLILSDIVVSILFASLAIRLFLGYKLKSAGFELMMLYVFLVFIALTLSHWHISWLVLHSTITCSLMS